MATVFELQCTPVLMAVDIIRMVDRRLLILIIDMNLSRWCTYAVVITKISV